MGILGNVLARLRQSPTRVATPDDGGGDRPARRATFVDADKQRQFEDDGFVVVELLDSDTVAEIRRRYDSMEHEHRDTYDWVHGFETSIYDPRPDYRHAILEVIEEHLAPPLTSILDNYRIMFANFVVKQPDSEPVPLHVDWTFLDEDRYSSVTVWCPLIDTSPDNGTLGLVSGSHRRIDFVRAANIPSFERCELAVADIDDRPVIRLHAGQAIILDNRVVHFSPPNRSGEPRVAIGCVAGPVEATLHHYWQDHDEQLLRFEIERAFYLNYMIGSPPSEADGVLSACVADSR